MVNIKLICVGEIKENFLSDAIKEYLKRLSRYCKINVIEVKDEASSPKASKKEEEQVLVNEGKRVIKQLKDQDYLVLIDLHGKEYDSLSLAGNFQKIISQHSSIALVIGGSLGLSDELRSLSKERWCLSKLTFPHQLTRVIVLEQLYRVFKINNNEIYHK